MYLRPEGGFTFSKFNILYERTPEDEQVEKNPHVNPTLHSEDIMLSWIVA